MQTDRSIALGLRRGFFTRCPACGEGALFGKYLKVELTCKACGHDNGQYRADDAPPYFTILLVGHLIIGPMLAFNFISTWPLAWVLGTTLPALFVATLFFLPRVKGAVIGCHWAAGVETPAEI